MAFPKTLEGYPPELFEAFRQGSEREVKIPFPTRRQATTMRGRLNYLRKLIRQTPSNPYTTFANSCEIAIEASGGPDAPATLILRPSGAKFTEAFRNAGISLAPPGSLVPLSSPSASHQPSSPASPLQTGGAASLLFQDELAGHEATPGGLAGVLRAAGVDGEKAGEKG